jgi:hypothetical protein
LTPESARTFDIGDGHTVMQYFHTKLNRQLRFPDLVCVKVRDICSYSLLRSHTL